MSWLHLSRQHLSWRHLSISRISQLLSTRFWVNFKSKFLGPSWTYSNCHGDIFPGDICPYQEYLSWYWNDFDQTLKEGSWNHLWQIPNVTVTFVQAIFVLTTFFHIMNSSVVPDPILTQFLGALIFSDQNSFWPKIFLEPKYFGNQVF